MCIRQVRNTNQGDIRSGSAAKHLLYVETRLERAGAAVYSATVDQHCCYARHWFTCNSGKLFVGEGSRNVARKDQVLHEHSHIYTRAVKTGPAIRGRGVIGLFQIIKPIGSSHAVSIVHNTVRNWSQ